MMPAEIENELFQIRDERLPARHGAPRALRGRPARSGARRAARRATRRMLIDLGALDGAHGKAEMKTARRLVLEGLAHGRGLRHPPPRGPDLGGGGHGLDPQAARARPCSTRCSTRTRAACSPASCRIRPRSRDEPAPLRSSFPLARRRRRLRRLRGARHGRARGAGARCARCRPRRSALYLADPRRDASVPHAGAGSTCCAPLGVSLPFRRLLLISSVGFMAILALPVRLGEFVRPYFVTRERHVRMSAMLGAVAVERIVDGLLISILFFGSYLASAGDLFTRELRVAAWLSLVGFVGLTTFLVLARSGPTARSRSRSADAAPVARADPRAPRSPTSCAPSSRASASSPIAATSPSSSSSRSSTGRPTASGCGSWRAR